MVSVRSAELLVNLITFLMAYFASVTIAGAFRAWVSKEAGDDTGEMMGLLTLNPLAHVDMIGIVFLMLFYFGWGRYVPINPHNITRPYRRLKLIAAYFSDTFAYLFSALIGITLLIIMVGPQMMFITQHMLVNVHNMSHLYLVNAYPSLSSLTVTLSFIVIAFVYLNVILTVLNLILNAFSLGMYLAIERSTRYDQFNYYLIVLIPIVLIFLFSEPLRLLAIRLITVTGYSISHLLGMV